MNLTVHKLEEHIGAEIQGVDISSPIADADVEQLRNAFYEHSVLVFRDQAITDDEHVSFSERFGPLEMSLASDPFGDGGPIFRIANVDDDGEIVPPEDTRALAFGWLISESAIEGLSDVGEGRAANRGRDRICQLPGRL